MSEDDDLQTNFDASSILEHSVLDSFIPARSHISVEDLLSTSSPSDGGIGPLLGLDAPLRSHIFLGGSRAKISELRNSLLLILGS